MHTEHDQLPPPPELLPPPELEEEPALPELLLDDVITSVSSPPYTTI